MAEKTDTAQRDKSDPSLKERGAFEQRQQQHSDATGGKPFDGEQSLDRQQSAGDDPPGSGGIDKGAGEEHAASQR